MSQRTVKGRASGGKGEKKRDAADDEMELEAQDAYTSSPQEKTKAVKKKNKQQQKGKEKKDASDEEENSSQKEKEVPQAGKKRKRQGSGRQAARRAGTPKKKPATGGSEEGSEGSEGDNAGGKRKSTALKPSLFEEFQALNEGATVSTSSSAPSSRSRPRNLTPTGQRLSKLRTRHARAREKFVPDSTLTFINDFNDIKPKYGTSLLTASNARTHLSDAQLMMRRTAPTERFFHVVSMDRR